MLDNIKFRKKMALSFGIVVALVLILTIITTTTAVQRKRQLEQMTYMSHFKDEAHSILEAFEDVRYYSAIVFEQMDVGDAYVAIYDDLNRLDGHLVNLENLADSMGGYHDDVIEELHGIVDAYRDSIHAIEVSDQSLTVASAQIAEAGKVLNENSASMYNHLSDILEAQIAEGNPSAGEFMRTMLIPTQQIGEQIDDMRVLTEALIIDQDSSVADQLWQYLEEIEKGGAAVSSRLDTDQGKLLSQRLISAAADYAGALQVALAEIDDSDRFIDIALQQMENSTTFLLRGIDVISTESAALMNDIAEASFVTSIINVVIAIVIVFLGTIIGFALSKSITRRLELMRQVLDQVGEHGDMSFTDEQIDRVREAAQTQDELGESLAAFNKVMEHIQEVSDALEVVAQGDLCIDIHSLGERDTMGNSLVTMIENLNNMFNEINQVSLQVASSSDELATGAQTLAQGATEQASTIEEISASVIEIEGQSKESAETASQAAKDTDHIRNIAQEGNVKMQNMMEAVQEISDSSKSIEQVIKVIDDIAFQTNILALNAAVEAARAGQHGKGFAVVADEVRNLAGKSAEAAKETATLIQASVEKADLGLHISEDTAQSLFEIIENIQHTSQSISQVAAQSEGAQSAVSQLNLAVDQVAQVVQHNSATSQQSAAFSEELSGQAQILQQLVSRFRLKDAEKPAPSPSSQTEENPYATSFAYQP